MSMHLKLHKCASMGVVNITALIHIRSSHLSTGSSMVQHGHSVPPLPPACTQLNGRTAQRYRCFNCSDYSESIRSTGRARTDQLSMLSGLRWEVWTGMHSRDMLSTGAQKGNFHLDLTSQPLHPIPLRAQVLACPLLDFASEKVDRFVEALLHCEDLRTAMNTSLQAGSGMRCVAARASHRSAAPLRVSASMPAIPRGLQQPSGKSSLPLAGDRRVTIAADLSTSCCPNCIMHSCVRVVLKHLRVDHKQLVSGMQGDGWQHLPRAE